MKLDKIEIVALSVIGVFDITAAVIHCAANKHAKKRAVKEALNSRGISEQKLYDDANRRCDIFKARSAKEKKDLEIKLKDWKVANEFDIRKREFSESVERGLEEFKGQIGYSEKMSELEETMNASIEAFKNTIDYDSSKRKLEKTIKEAKDHYESQKALFDLASDDISENAMKLRHAEEEVMNGKVKEAKAQLDILETKLKEETERLQNAKLEQVRALEEQVSKEKLRLGKKSEEDLRKLNNEYDSAKEDISKKLRKARSEEETNAFKHHEDDIRIIREQNDADKLVAEQILDDTPCYERIGVYLKEKKIPKSIVLIGFLIPAGAVGYLIGTMSHRYARFVGQVLAAMG